MDIKNPSQTWHHRDTKNEWWFGDYWLNWYEDTFLTTRQIFIYESRGPMKSISQE